MILMGVVHSRRKDHIDVWQASGKGVEDVLDLDPMRWQSPVWKFVKGGDGIRKERPSRCFGLRVPLV